jgi:hypothetical protein
MNNNEDSDCVAVCGNGTVEPDAGEECDPPGALCDAECHTIEPPKPPKSFRVNSMQLRDPHVWFNLFGCKDVTDIPISGDLAVNIQINKQLTEDADGDGNYDMSPVVKFAPYDTSDGAGSDLTLDVGAVCKKNDSGCTAGTQKYDGEATSVGSGLCLGKLSGTTNAAYTGGINEPRNQCFATAERDIAINIQGSDINLRHARVAAVYSTGALSTGLIRGFLTEEDANNTTLEVSGFKIVLASVLAGGTDCCKTDVSDKDSVDGVAGWWFYLNYTAVETAYQ